MNKLRTILTWGLLAAVTHVMGYTITVNPIEIEAGQSTNLIINLNNTETNLTAYQMSLYLPEGVMVQKKANGKYAYTSNTDRLDPDLFTVTVKDAADGSILIAVFAPDKDVITGTSGELIRLPLNVASTVTTSLQGSIKNIEFTDVNSQAHNVSDINFTLTMQGSSTPDPGNDELIISVPDVTIAAGSSAEIVVNMESSMTNLTAYQMSLYLPEGVTVQKKANGKYAYTSNTNRLDPDLFTVTVKDATDGSILIAVFAPDKDVITGTSGELIRLPIDVASTVTTSLQGSIKNIEFTDTNSQAHNHANVTISFNITEKEEQTLSLTALPEMTEGDAAYTLPQQTNQGLNLTWGIADATIASISGYQLTPLKAGTTTVTATQAGNDNYLPFTQTFTLTVNEKQVQPGIEVTDISQLDNAIYIDRVEARAGETVTLSVKMKNSFIAEGFGFDLVLPEGITVALDEYGFPIAELSTERTNSRITNHFDVDFKLDGSLNVQAYSSRGLTISGHDGEVALITIKVSEGLEAGEYPIILRNIAITDENSTTVTMESVTCVLEVPSYIIGDANNDGNVNVGDLTAISHYILERPDASFLFQAADANQDGNVNVGDLTAVSHIILWGSIVRPQQAAPRKDSQSLDPQ